MRWGEHLKKAWYLVKWKLQEWWMERLGFGLKPEFNQATEAF